MIAADSKQKIRDVFAKPCGLNAFLKSLTSSKNLNKMVAADFANSGGMQSDRRRLMRRVLASVAPEHAC